MMDEQAMEEGEPIADRIMAQAERYAAGKGYRLGEGAEHQFRHVAGLAADVIVQTPLESDARRAKTAEAARNFRAMIDAMIDARPAAYAGDAERLEGDIIGEVTLAAAHDRLCPIWPFC